MLQKLLSDRALAKQLARQGRDYVLENYTWERIIQKFKTEVFG
jgi:glycosyltransferase involved in cell wall biosynthesis